jgi:osomolarity two-component system, sensor histidine kinase NIK1
MKKSSFLAPFINPYTGPIVVASLIILVLVVSVVPDLSSKNQIAQLQSKAESSVNKLKKIRSYYTTNVIGKVKKNTDLNINYDHAQKEETIPLPATLLHNLSQILPDNGMTVNLYSNYPFPNRAERVLDADQKEGLEFVENNPYDTHVKLSTHNGKQVLKVTLADIFYDQGCVNCHNTRADTPKADWEIGDVRGALQVIMPYESYISLNSTQMSVVGGILIILIIILSIHYTYISINQKKKYKEIEEDLEKKIANRTKMLNEYKKAVDSSAIVSKTDKYGIITYVNDEFVKISQFTQDELIGKSHNLVRHQDMSDEVFKDLWATIKSGKTWQGQIKNRAKDGTSYYVASTIVPLINAQDEIEEFLAIRLDVSEIIESKIQAEKADMTKSTFLANMSHEIRTPLNAILGFSQVLSGSKTLNIEEKKQASVIETSANSLLMIINDILDISKIESGNFQVNISSTDLYFIAEHVVELFTKRATQKNIRFIFNIDSKIPLCIQTDGTRIRQVLSNLLSNAIKFTESYGSIYLNLISLGTKDDKAVIRFEVIDTGIGIPQEQQKNIFQPFIQVDSQSNRKYEGTGLGLSICTHIVESFGSRINIDSKEGEGTRFWFDLEFDICGEVMFEKTHYAHGLEFKIMDKESDLYHYAKRYLNIFGKINFEIDSQEADILIIDYNKDNSTKLEELRNGCNNPKLVLFEYEKDLQNFTFRNNEAGVCLPFYASKVNDKIQELINNSMDFNHEQKREYVYKGHILVAEDNLANQELITFVLNSVGVDFDIASNGKEAVGMFKNNKYDLVFMDINMPIMDGIEAFKLIREHESDIHDSRISYVPVIALTANAIKGDKEKFLSLGMNDYVSKPIEMDKLTVIFDKYLIKNEVVIDTKESTLEEVENKEDNVEIEEVTNEESSAEIILDPKQIASTLGVSESIGTILINKFKTEIPKDLKELEDIIESDDFDAIKSKAHYIKNSCLNLGLKEICEDVQQIETEIKDLDELKTKFKKLKKDILSIK